MRKIRTTIVMSLVAMMLIMPVQASAAAGASVQSVQLYNERYCPANPLEECGKEIVRIANHRINAIIQESVQMAEMTDDPCALNVIIASMLVRTTAVSQAAQIAAGLCGVQTVCDYVDVEIGGHVVAVDPLRVVLV